jgi:hypothetical protein
MRALIRSIRKDFKLTEEPAAKVDGFDDLAQRLTQLTYEGVRSAQST